MIPLSLIAYSQLFMPIHLILISEMHLVGAVFGTTLDWTENFASIDTIVDALVRLNWSWDDGVCIGGVEVT